MTSLSRSQRFSVLAVLSAMALVVLDAGLANIALPSMSRTLRVEPGRAVLIVSTYQLALVVGLLPSAHIAERVGYRRVFVLGLALFACGSLACAAARTLPFLVFARFVQGIGGAGVMALGVALLRAALGGDRLGTVIGWNALTVALCSACAPLLGASVLYASAWPWLFLINLPVAAIALCASAALPTIAPRRASIDLVAIALLAGGAALGVVAAELLTTTPLLAAALAVIGCAFLTLLVKREWRQPLPLVPLDLLALGAFRSSALSSICIFAAQSAGLVALPFYLQLGLGRGALASGLILALWPVAVACSSAVSSRLSNKLALPSLCAAGGAILSAGLACTTVAISSTSPAPLAVCVIACGLGFGLFQVPNNRRMFEAASRERSAAAGGLQGTARLAGQTTGALVVSVSLSAFGVQTGLALATGIGAATALAGACLNWASRVVPCAEPREPSALAR